MRIGVFGGTFDPPHIGHLLLASDARDALQLDRLIFVPVGVQPFKVETPPVASGQDRLEMVRLAIGNDPNYAVDDTEISRKGLSYTVDTLDIAGGRCSQFFFCWARSAAGFRHGDPERILEIANLALMMIGLGGSVGWRNLRVS